jgi:signal peptidase I
MNFDFSAILVFLTFGSGMIWAIDAWKFAPARNSEQDKQGAEGNKSTSANEPFLVETARSFFPIFLIVLILRSFIAEPFRIPSASMMPTLLIGDFILVNKFDFGIRLPVLNTKIINNKRPEKGDVIVFRYPVDPSIPYIKRVVGVPGDHITYYNKTLHINGVPVAQEILGKYRVTGSGKEMDGWSWRQEILGEVEHNILVDPQRGFGEGIEVVVPAGNYFVMGDNRDNSKDSRYWGFVPDENLIGRAFLVWMNWDWQNGGINWQRIGMIM